MRARDLVLGLALAVAGAAFTPGPAPAAPKGRPAARTPARKKPAARPRPAAPEPRPAPVVEETPPAPEPAPETPAAPAPAAPAAEAPPPESAPPAPAPDKAAPPPPSGPDLARLKAEHAALRDALFRARARRDLVENAVLSTKLLAVVRWDGSRRYSVKHAELRLDGVRLWEASEGQLTDREVALAPRSAPPGPHVLSVRIEVRARDNPKLGYVSEQTFALDLQEGKKTTAEVTIDEDGSLPSYNPDIELELDVDD